MLAIDLMVRQAWLELINKPLRKVPDADTALITLAELKDFMERTAPLPPTPIRKKSGPRPVVLDAQGNAVMPPPIVQQFEGERRDQYALDRHMAVMSLDPDQWRIFSLRWGLTPPPGGWDNHEAITNVMHAVRLTVRSVPYIEKHVSAVHLTSKGIKLPPPLTLVGGVLYGHDTIDPTKD